MILSDKVKVRLRTILQLGGSDCKRSLYESTGMVWLFNRVVNKELE